MKLKKEKINLIIISIYTILNTNSFFNKSIPIIVNCCLLFLLLMINKKEIIRKNKNFFFLIIMNLISLISILLTNGGIGSFLNLLNFSLGILMFYEIKINNEDYKVLIMLISIIFFKMFFESFNIWENYLLGTAKINPNGVAQNLFLCFCIIITYLKKYKNKMIPIVLILLILMSGYAIYKCNSRTILLAFIVYLLSTYTPIINKFIKKNLKLILNILIITGLIIPFIYVYMYQNGYNFTIPFSDKSLYTGRERLWGYMIEALNTNKINYILGLGTNHITYIGVIDNYHSWYIGTLYTFGIFIFYIYYKYLINIIIKIQKKEITYALISIFVIGFFETAALWSNTQIYIFLILLFDKYNKKEVELYE